MALKRVIVDINGVLSEILDSDTINPRHLGTGTIGSDYILNGDGQWVTTASLNYWTLTAGNVHRATGNVIIGSASSIGSFPLQVIGNSYFSGNVGINNLSPIYPLDVTGNAGISGIIYANGVGNNIRLRANNTSALDGFVGAASDGNIYLANWDGNRGWRIHPTTGNITNLGTGFVGIGTTTPTHQLQVVGAIRQSGATSAIVRADASGILVNATGAEIATALGQASGNYIQNQTAALQTAGYRINAGTYEVRTATYSLDIGLGEVAGGWARAFRIVHNTDSNGTDGGAFGVLATDSTPNYVYMAIPISGGSIGYNSTKIISLNNAGNVGIGITNPQERLHTYTSTGNSCLIIERATSAQGQLGIQFRTAGNSNWYNFQDTNDITKLNWWNTTLSAVVMSMYNSGIVVIGDQALVGTKRLQVKGGIRVDDIASQLVYANGTGEFLAATSGTILSSIGGNYIQNQYSGAQATSNFWISGTGRMNAMVLTGANNPTLIYGAVGNSWTFGDTVAYYMTINSSNGRVGIGTTVPLSLLQIDGADSSTPNANFPTSHLTLNSTSTAAVGMGSSIRFAGQSGNGVATYTFGVIQGSKDSATASDYRGNLRFYTTQSDGGLLERMIINGIGNVGIGTVNPIALLQIAERILLKSDGTIQWGSTYDSGLLSWDTAKTLILGMSGRSLSFGSNGVVDRIFLNTVGNVGVGTILPLGKLHITGLARIGGEPTFRGDIIIDQSLTVEAGNGGLEFKTDGNVGGYGKRILDVFDGSSNYNLHFQSRGNSASWTSRMVMTNSGMLLLGTNSTYNGTSKLQVNGSILQREVFGTTPIPKLLGAIADGTIVAATAASISDLLNVTNTGSGDYIRNNIANTATSQAAGFRIGATGFAQAFVGATNVTSGSDVRFKKDIKDVTNIYNRIKDLNLKSYIKFDQHEIGYIAQDVQRIFPQMIVENDGYLYLNYGSIGAVALQLGKETRTEVEKLKERVLLLEAKLEKHGITD